MTTTSAKDTRGNGADRRLPVLLSVNVGMPRDVSWQCKTVHTGVWKHPVDGGVCHTRITPLLSGDITYSPDPLDPPASEEVLICCAQPANNIVLDL